MSHDKAPRQGRSRYTSPVEHIAHSFYQPGGKEWQQTHAWATFNVDGVHVLAEIHAGDPLVTLTLDGRHQYRKDIDLIGHLPTKPGELLYGPTVKELGLMTGVWLHENPLTEWAVISSLV